MQADQAKRRNSCENEHDIDTHDIREVSQPTLSETSQLVINSSHTTKELFPDIYSTPSTSKNIYPPDDRATSSHSSACKKCVLHIRDKKNLKRKLDRLKKKVEDMKNQMQGTNVSELLFQYLSQNQLYLMQATDFKFLYVSNTFCS